MNIENFSLLKATSFYDQNLSLVDPDGNIQFTFNFNVSESPEESPWPLEIHLDFHAYPKSKDIEMEDLPKGSTTSYSLDFAISFEDLEYDGSDEQNTEILRSAWPLMRSKLIQISATYGISEFPLPFFLRIEEDKISKIQ